MGDRDTDSGLTTRINHVLFSPLFTWLLERALLAELDQTVSLALNCTLPSTLLCKYYLFPLSDFFLLHFSVLLALSGPREHSS